MEKKELKFYEAPSMEVVEMEVAQFLCASGGGVNGDDLIGGSSGDDF